MNTVKLVIWDLDETFWNGTLSEGGVESVEANIEVVRTLTDRGIVNSIVSKNDFDPAKAVLEQMGVWELFVFPQIDWRPKGELVREVIRLCQLRAPNVLFLDDNPSNLEEARFYNDGLMTAGPEAISGLLSSDAASGKDDRARSRLQQYKVLEVKASEQRLYSDNTAFLRASNVRVQLDDVGDAPTIDRLHELLERSNQLNFTKVRPTRSELETTLQNGDLESRAVRVADNYGDYGVAGFYCLDRSAGALKHFVFSCRVLNLGVEQFVYDHLSRPSITVVPNVASELGCGETPDWISIVQGELGDAGGSEKAKSQILFRGGCDLSQMMSYLSRFDFEICEETNYVAQNGMPIHNDHSELVLGCATLSDADKRELAESLPFVDGRTFETRMFDGAHDVVVHSVLMDYAQQVYEHKQRGWRIPFGGYSLPPLTQQDAHDVIIDHYAARGVVGFDKPFLQRFSSEYTHRGLIDAKHFANNLREIRARIPSSVPLILVNGAEVDSCNVQEGSARRRHEQMNRVLDEFVQANANCRILDVRNRVKDTSQLTDSIRHYQRLIYRGIADDLLEVLRVDLALAARKTWSRSSVLRDVKDGVRYALGPVADPLFGVMKRLLPTDHARK